MSEITLEQLYEMQKALDARIIKEKGLEGQDLLPNTVLALQVEIGELANEWRGFKHWSKDRAPRREKIVHDGHGGILEYKDPLLEEYVDCLHFILSIARQLKVPNGLLIWPIHDRDELHSDTAAVFTSLLYEVAFFNAESFLTNPPFMSKHRRLSFVLHEFMQLGARLGFTFEQITAAYLEKNKTNHERQANGY